MKEYMKEVSVQDAIKAGRNDTLCWDCKKACRGGCSWADPTKQEPVEDWVATKTDHGYVVHACPQFDRETYGGGMYRSADDYILALEIAVTERNHKIENIKKTSWYRYAHKLACNNRVMSMKIKELEKQIEKYKRNGGEAE